MKMTTHLSIFLALLFVFEAFILCGGFLFVKKDIDNINEQNSSLALVDDSLIEEIVFHHIQGNIQPKNFLLYELVEINRLDSASYLSEKGFREEASSLTNCMDKEGRTFCETMDSSTRVSFIPLKFEGRNVGHLMLKKRIQNTENLFFRMIVMVAILFIFLSLNILGIWLFFKMFFQKDMVSILKVVKSGDASLEVKLKTKEFSQIREIFRQTREKIHQMEKEKREALTLQEKEKIAVQVAHDIRSPLTALDVATHETDSVPENYRIIIRSCINSIKDIANNLLDSYRKPQGNKNESTSGLIAQLVESVVSQKRMQYRHYFGVNITINPSPSSYGLFASVNPLSFKRVISNIIDNSVESFKDGTGKVEITIMPENDNVVLKISDNGKGIAKDNIHEVFQRGKSIGKPKGAGFGLSYAKESTESWGGLIGIESQLEKGTDITIKLPQSDP